jgi:hypothetical protein
VLKAGATTAAETDQDRVLALTLTKATACELTFNLPPTAQCVAGTVTLTRNGAQLLYRWSNSVEQNTAT